MDSKYWQSVKRPFDTNCQGRFVLILGPAKMGKTTVLSQLYNHFDPERIFWISGGELDGWRVVKKAVGQEPEGVDLDELDSLGAFWRLLDSLRDGWHQVVVLDSFDGSARWAERHICRADARRRRDKSTGIDKLDQRGYGLKLNWTVATVRDYLYPITIAGTHVIVTCGLKSVELGREPVLVPDIEGQSSLLVPRFFGDVAVLLKRGHERILSFDGMDSLSVYGSRSGFPDVVESSQFGALLSRPEGFVKEKSPQSESLGERPWWEIRFPDLGYDYRLEAGDIEATASNSEGLPLEDALNWQARVVEKARRLKEDDRIRDLKKRDLALVCWAHRLIEEREEALL